MNSKQTYLAWVRTTNPKLYWQAIQRVFGPVTSGLSGLGDDLTLSVVGTPTDVGVSSDVTDAINNATATATTDTNTDWFGSIANAINSIAPTVVQTQAAENLLQINSARAAQGLPLYSSNGQIVTSQMLSPTSSSIAQMEAALSAGSGTGLLWIAAGVALLAIAMSGGHRGGNTLQ